MLRNDVEALRAQVEPLPLRIYKADRPIFEKVSRAEAVASVEAHAEAAQKARNVTMRRRTLSEIRRDAEKASENDA